MATVETIKALGNETNITSSVNSILKIVKDKQDLLNQCIDSLAKLISDDKNEKIRPKYLYFLTKVLSKNASNVSPAQLLESLKASIPQEGRKEQHRRRRTAYILCLSCISRAGLLSENLSILSQYVQTLYNITLEHPFHSPQVYTILADIARANIPDADTFMDIMLPILNESQSHVGKSVDILYFWTTIGHLFSKVSMDDLLKKPLTPEYIKKYQNLLNETKFYRPSIHPIWYLFAEIDHKKLMDLVTELWVPKYKEYQSCIAYSSCVSIPHFSDEELVEFLSNEALFVSSLSYVPDKLIIPVLQPKIQQIFDSNSPMAFNVLISLLSIEGEHSFITKIVNEKLSKFSDEETSKLIDLLKDSSFSSFKLLLWAQKSRTNIQDYNIISKVFETAAAHIQTEQDKLDLSNFVGVCLLRMANGITWFTLLTGIEFSLSDAPQSINELADLTNKLIEGLNKINKTLNIKPEIKPVEGNIKSIAERLGFMIKSPHVHIQKIAKLQLERALPYLDAETAPAIFGDGDLLRLAVKMPALCASVLPSFIEHIRDIPNSVRTSMLEESFLRLPISREDAANIASDVVNKCKPQESETAKKLQDRYTTALINMLSDEEIQKLTTSQIDKILLNDCDYGINVITNIIGSSSQSAYDVITYLTKIASKVSGPKRLEIMRNWISECCNSGDLTSDTIADAIYAAINYPYEETNSGKKLAEAALKWADKLLKKLERDIPRDKFKSLTPIVVATGSRTAANIIRQITYSNE